MLLFFYGFYRPTFVLIDKRGSAVGYAVYKSVGVCLIVCRKVRSYNSNI